MVIKAMFTTAGSVEPCGMKGSGTWVSFPISESTFIEVLNKISADLADYSRYMFHITQWEVPGLIKEEFEGHAFDLRRTNKVAEYLRDMDVEDIHIVKALLEADWDLEDACRIVANSEYTDLRSQADEDIVREYVDNNNDVPDFIMDNVDWSKAADDFFSEMSGYVHVSTGNTTGYIWVET